MLGMIVVRVNRSVQCFDIVTMMSANMLGSMRATG